MIESTASPSDSSSGRANNGSPDPSRDHQITRPPDSPGPPAPSGDVDRLNAVGVLTRREIEARILAPVIDALGARFGRDEVVAIVREVIVNLAREQGRAMAEARGDHSLTGFAATLEPWTRDGALRLEAREQTDERLSFDVTRCRYAEMYRALGIPELGALLSCNRDAALIEGFNPDVTLVRTQTIMQGASHCDFRYAAASADGSGDPPKPPAAD